MDTLSKDTEGYAGFFSPGPIAEIATRFDLSFEQTKILLQILKGHTAKEITSKTPCHNYDIKKLYHKFGTWSTKILIMKVMLFDRSNNETNSNIA